MVFEWGGAYHSPLGTDCWCLITRSNNIYICFREWDLNSVRDIKVYVDGVGHTPGDPESVSLNTSYHTEQQYMFDICF